jgi:type II secretory pathway predicted ATPase ExeA
LPTLCSFHVGAKELAEAILIDRVGGKLEHRLRRRFLARLEAIAVELQEEHAHDEAGALVAVDEGEILDNAGRAATELSARFAARGADKSTRPGGNRWRGDSQAGACPSAGRRNIRIKGCMGEV